MTTPKAAMFFAAGFGTRMAPLTDTLPKPLIEVAGRTLLDHALDLTKPVQLERRVINTHYRHAQIKAHVAGSDVLLSHETPDILDTGGGLRLALPLLGSEPLFTLNTDAIWTGPNPLETLAQAWDPYKMDALLICVPSERTLGHLGKGDFDFEASGQLVRGGPFVYSGVQIINPIGLDAVPDRVFSLNVLWDTFAAKGRLHGVIHPGHWCDVGQPQSIALAEGLLASV